MGQVIEILKKIRNMPDTSLFNRFEHIVCVQSLREYLGKSKDKNLDLEIRLAKEEILKRMFKVDKPFKQI